VDAYATAGGLRPSASIVLEIAKHEQALQANLRRRQGRPVLAVALALPAVAPVVENQESPEPRNSSDRQGRVFDDS
jgi:hypothetical protein